MQNKTLLSWVGVVLVVAGVTALASAYLISIDTTPGAYVSGIMAGALSIGDDSLIRVNLHTGSITLFKGGSAVKQATIAAAGNPLDRTATPTGSFRVLSKERMHVSRLSGVLMPYSLRFFEGYYFHAIPLTPGGAIINTKYSHGCIRLPDGVVEEVYAWAAIGTRVEIYRAHLVKSAESPTVYALSPDGIRSAISTEQAFISRGYLWQDIVTIPAEELAIIPQGEPML